MSLPVRLRVGAPIAAAMFVAAAVSVTPAHAAPANIAGMIVFLDPGHQAAMADMGRQVPNGRGGTKDCQASGTSTDDGFPEHTFTWETTLKIRQLLSQYGVRTAMSGGQARRLCPAAVVVPPRMTAYGLASDAVFDVFRDITPLVEPISVDEAFLDVAGLRRLSGEPLQIGATLREQVRERVGLPITVGIARTKFLAKVASQVAKPDGLDRKSVV